jgi:hypothetical protein
MARELARVCASQILSHIGRGLDLPVDAVVVVVSCHCGLLDDG